MRWEPNATVNHRRIFHFFYYYCNTHIRLLLSPFRYRGDKTVDGYGVWINELDGHDGVGSSTSSENWIFLFRFWIFISDMESVSFRFVFLLLLDHPSSWRHFGDVVCECEPSECEWLHAYFFFIIHLRKHRNTDRQWTCRWMSCSSCICQIFLLVTLARVHNLCA